MYSELEQIGTAYRKLYAVRTRMSEDLEQLKLCLDREDPNVTMALEFVKRLEVLINS